MQITKYENLTDCEGCQTSNRDDIYSVELPNNATIHLCRNCLYKFRMQIDTQITQCASDGIFTDSRDWKKYRTVKIGKQTWMADNLAFECDGSMVYGNDPDNQVKYGRLYNWEMAMNKNVLPLGWHLPSNEEWNELFSYISSIITQCKGHNVGKYLKAREGWNGINGKSGNGEGEFGFEALPGGIFEIGHNFKFVGEFGYWWSASESYDKDSKYIDFSDSKKVLTPYNVETPYGATCASYFFICNHQDFIRQSSNYKTSFCSVRCIHD
jgi:uncharacterized protein (TIGR02145 family)